MRISTPIIDSRPERRRADRAGDLVWVHDYQLLLVPALLREPRPDVRIGFFLHIPFPSSEIFGILPQRSRCSRACWARTWWASRRTPISRQLPALGAAWLGLDSRMDSVAVGDRSGASSAAHRLVRGEWARLAEGWRGPSRARGAAAPPRPTTRPVVDRLDYTKGIPERLRAFRRLLRREPERRGKVTLVQVAVPTRERSRPTRSCGAR